MTTRFALLPPYRARMTDQTPFAPTSELVQSIGDRLPPEVAERLAEVAAEPFIPTSSVVAHGRDEARTLDAVRAEIAKATRARRVMFCRPEVVDRVQAVIDEAGVAGLFEVRPSTDMPPGFVFVTDTNAGGTVGPIQLHESERQGAAREYPFHS